MRRGPHPAPTGASAKRSSLCGASKVAEVGSGRGSNLLKSGHPLTSTTPPRRGERVKSERPAAPGSTPWGLGLRAEITQHVLTYTTHICEATRLLFVYTRHHHGRSKFGARLPRHSRVASRSRSPNSLNSRSNPSTLPRRQKPTTTSGTHTTPYMPVCSTPRAKASWIEL